MDGQEHYEKAKRFEERVAELFRLHGYQPVVDYKRNDQQFDIKLEKRGVPPTYVLVECKDTNNPVGLKQLHEFVSKVQSARMADNRPYQSIIVARSGFVNSAYSLAEHEFVHLMTFQDLVLSLVDLTPNLEAAVQTFRGTPLEDHYVEQDAVLETDIRPGEVLNPRKLTETVLEWLDRPAGTLLTLLGDFGCGKTSFCKRLASDLAVRARESPGTVRAPILIDLREGGSTTVTLENLLTHHFQRLSSQPINPQALLHLNREGYLLLIFDGFDETIGYTEPGRYVENLRQILRAAEGKAKVLLTCRTHYFRDRPEALRRLGQAPEMISTLGATQLYGEIQEYPGSQIGYVLEFQEPQIEEYLQKALPPPADWRSFHEQIRRTYNLNDLAERPFLLEMIVKTVPKMEAFGHRTQVTIADLYDTYCEGWFQHTDFRLTLTREHKVALVQYLARLIWNSPENKVHYRQLANQAAEFFQDRPLTAYEKERIDYEVRTALFLHRDSDGYYSFAHRSFLEFFIARTLRAGLATGNLECLKIERITREAAFYLECWPEADLIINFSQKILSSEYQPKISENALLLLYYHSLAATGQLQPLWPKEGDNFEPVTQHFSKSRPSTLHLEGASLEDAHLRGIDLSNAYLQGANLARADLTQALLDCAVMPHASLRQASLYRARLTQSLLDFADLRQASFEQAILSEASLNHVDAQDSIFRKAVLTNADLEFSRFTRVDLSGANLHGARMTGTGLLKARLPRRTALPQSAGAPKYTAAELSLQFGHAAKVTGATWSPNGYCVATCSVDRTVRLWDAANGCLLRTLYGHQGSVNCVAWSPDSHKIASSSNDCTINIWNVISGQVLNVLTGHKDWVNSIAWSPDGTHLASASDDCTAFLWNVENAKAATVLQGHEDAINCVTWSPDNKRLATASRDQTVRLWEANTGRLLKTLREGSSSSVTCVSWAPDGRRIASALGSAIGLWDASRGSFVRLLQGHEDLVTSIAWASDGYRLASSSLDNTVRLWDTDSGRLLSCLTESEDDAQNLDSKEEERSAGTRDSTMTFWRRARRLLNVRGGSRSSLTAAAWSPDSNKIASTSTDGTVSLWDVENSCLFTSIPGYSNGVRSLAISATTDIIASASEDNDIRLWEAATGRMLNSLKEHEGPINSLAWSSEGTLLASASADHTLRLWDLGKESLPRIYKGHEKAVNSVAWAPGDQKLATASDDYTVRLWNKDSTSAIATLKGHESPVNSVAWAPHGQRIASSAHDNTVRIWDTSNGRLLATLEGHEDWVRQAIWSPNGKRIISASDDNTIRLWESRSGELLYTAREHKSSVHSIAWSPNGQLLASASRDSTVLIWGPNLRNILYSIRIPLGVSCVNWRTNTQIAASSPSGFTEIWDISSDQPRLIVRLYNTPGSSGFAHDHYGRLHGTQEALEYVRFSVGLATYDLTDLPELVCNNNSRT